MILGITGVFGSGKTTVAKMFAEHGYLNINADEIGHKLLNKISIKHEVINIFGNSILTGSKIDRKKLKMIVFNNHKELIKLNGIIHPVIIKEISSIIKKSKNKSIIVDGALLIEVGCMDLFDKVIVVKISKEEQLKRVAAKNKYTKQEIKNIISSQLPQKEKLKYADIVVDNSGRFDYTKVQVEKVINNEICK